MSTAGPSEQTAAPATPAAARREWRRRLARLPRVRWLVQGAYAVFLVLVGVEFWLFYQQVMSGEPITVSRPPAVEAFLPISALLGLKRLLLTGRWDDLHPAGLAIFVGALVSSFAARKAFCSWVCPVGTASRGLEWIGRKLLWRRRRSEVLLPRWLDAVLSAPKYLLLGFFVWMVFFQMDLESIDAFLGSPYNKSADARMLHFFTGMSATAGVVLVALVVLSAVVKNFWCRFLCPYGALLGCVSWASPQRVVRDAATCTDCRACTRACPVEIRVHAKSSVLSPECTGCLSCVAACPVKSCLTVGRRAERGWSPWLVPGLAVGVLIAVWLLALASGHWHTGLGLPDLVRAYRIGALAHP